MNDYSAKPIDERLLYSKIVGLVKKPIAVTYTEDTIITDNNDKKERCIDLAYLMRRTKSDSKLMMEMISAYLEQTPPLISMMKQSFQEKDWHSLHMTVHKMIPSFSIMGINTTFENMAKKIQEYAITQEQTDTISDMVLQIESICTQACMELTEEFNMIKNTKP